MNAIQRIALKFFRIKPPKVWVQPHDALAIRLRQWQENTNLVEESVKLAAMPTYRSQLDVLRVEHPCHSVLALDVPAHARVALQCRIEGYELCLNNLEAFAKQHVEKPAEESTFESDEPQPTE